MVGHRPCKIRSIFSARRARPQQQTRCTLLQRLKAVRWGSLYMAELKHQVVLMFKALLGRWAFTQGTTSSLSTDIKLIKVKLPSSATPFSNQTKSVGVEAVWCEQLAQNHRTQPRPGRWSNSRLLGRQSYALPLRHHAIHRYKISLFAFVFMFAKLLPAWSALASHVRGPSLMF